MSPDDPNEPGSWGDGDDNPFAGIPIFGDLARMLRQQGPVSWDAARQFAVSVATGADAEPNVDPVERMRLEQLGRVAELHVGDATGLDVAPSGQLTVQPVNRMQWAVATMDAYRPLFEVLAESLADDDDSAPADPTDPLAALAPLLKMVGPMMLGLTAGSMVGHLARRCFGQYDLPVPRASGDRILVCVPNIEAFRAEWSLPADDLALWVCLHETTTHAVLGVPAVRARLDADMRAYMGGFEPDGDRLESMFGGLDTSDTGPDALQRLFGDPEVVLGAVRSPGQLEVLPRLAALVAVVLGYVDHIMDKIGGGLLNDYGMLSEALRRRRVEASASDRFVEQLFGLELTQEAYDRGTAFVRGVIERAGEPGLARLWRGERELPTPAEVDAPGLWLARIDLPDD